MAVSPEQLRANLENEAKTYEHLLDKALVNLKITNGSSVSVPAPSGMLYLHYQVLKDRYLKAGWGNVKWHNDQRDGDYIVFETKKPYSSNGWMDR